MNGTKLSRTVVVTNPQGIHARPADLLVKLANRFTSRLTLIKGSERVDARSILQIMTLAATEGTELSIEADGQDAEQALDAVAELLGQKFHEEE